MSPREAHTNSPHTWTWYAEGDAFFAAVRADIAAARRSVRLETYIYEAEGIGRRIRDDLVAAARRGVHVRVLVDGFGSRALPASFWVPLRETGGDVRVFSPLWLNRLGIRDHRKLLVCDEEVAFVGGFNIAAVSEGDGVERGWRDTALRVSGPLVHTLSATFDRMHAAAAFRRKAFARLRRAEEKRIVAGCGCEALLSGPGRGGSPLVKALCLDLADARSVRILVAYFLPTRRLWRAILRAARRGATVELLVPGKSDVALSKLATESLYRRLLRAGARVFEYQPRMLHGKLFIVDDSVYVGSSNLDPRSLRLNYELMVRVRGPETAAAARRLFDETRSHAREVREQERRNERSLWLRLKRRFAHFVMARLDLRIARRQWRLLPD
jgi:cardiolipin synthase